VHVNRDEPEQLPVRDCIPARAFPESQCTCVIRIRSDLVVVGMVKDPNCKDHGEVAAPGGSG
jgi:hypothetical protein